MPREIALGDALVPGLLLILVLTLIPLWLIDWVSGRFGLYDHVWHPPLFRLALFVGVFGSIALLFFQ
jgi:protein AaeX